MEMLLLTSLSVLVAALALRRLRRMRARVENNSGGAEPLTSEAAAIDIDPILAFAARNGWTCEPRPSPALLYRMQGATSQGLRWEVIQGLPTEHERRNRGLRWSTNDIRIRHLWLEIFPRAVYDRMKSKPANPALVPDNRSLDSLKMIHETPSVPFRDPSLNERLALVTILPTMTTLLLNEEVEAALVKFGGIPLRISLGYPNLRVSITDHPTDDETLQRLVDLGVLLAERYIALESSMQFEESNQPFIPSTTK
jgi:hypothetical protein